MPHSEKADLVIHPIRLQIFLALSNRSLTTAEIAQALPLVPQASLYRHLKKLLQAGMIEVVETRAVRGVQEKVYRLRQQPHLSQADMEQMSREDLFHYFNQYTASLLKSFNDYLLSTPEPMNFLEDQTGFSETTFFADNDDMDRFLLKLVAALSELQELKPGGERRQRKLAIISHPLRGKENKNE